MMEQRMIRMVEARLEGAERMTDVEAQKAQVIRAEGTMDALHMIITERMRYNNISATEPIPADLLSAYQDPTFMTLARRVEALSKQLWPEFDPD
jgi:hypothetical protein